MNVNETLALMQQVKDGKITPDEAVLKLKMQPFEDLGYAKIDHHRALRQGVAEVIYGAGKTPAQIEGIVSLMEQRGQETILITRVSREAVDLLLEKGHALAYHEIANVAVVGEMPQPKEGSFIAIATGGTSDMAVAEEAALTAEALGNKVVRLYDVGVAGLHRLLNQMDTLMQAKVVIAVAGMEGALASVVGGLVDCPVIAVPTSIGYGANFGGLSALLSMLNSCASGVSVVNIDNGFGAGYLAGMINKIGG